MFGKFEFIVRINGLSSIFDKYAVFYWQKISHKFVYFDTVSFFEK